MPVQVVVQPFLRFITGAHNGGNDAGVPSASGVITGWRNVMTLALHNKLPADIHVHAHGPPPHQCPVLRSSWTACMSCSQAYSLLYPNMQQGGVGAIPCLCFP